MIFLIALLPLPESYLSCILCILCAYMVKPKHVGCLMIAACIACIQYYKDLTILSMLPLQIIACIMSANLSTGTK